MVKNKTIFQNKLNIIFMSCNSMGALSDNRKMKKSKHKAHLNYFWDNSLSHMKTHEIPCEAE